ncbi:MAG: Fur family transcriptional regulator [Anaerovoracaceae bacterium]|jgi:Fur family peroxide stress response transcriptional regulator
MKYSKQRQLVYRILKSTDIHPTAYWVYQKASREMPGIGLATVYRNLNDLVKSGHAVTITTAGNKVHYDARTDEHLHFQCECCGRILDLVPTAKEGTEPVRRALREAFGVAERNVRIEKTLLQGICNNCLKQQNRESCPSCPFDDRKTGS